ncbi:hypothetical protein GALMADRAFT_146954 [Galerina marginata CBS 339.88]|uniref:Uncharacterized protein n=1 Tax=Galerina marginata (strain CBS 339.88) TaxID=685588 RepID=A0A067SLM3_GALM3|nr:hypothetical protein GALMADRAFT_146954 [Galerina marginata CBS 339.88]
MPATPTHSPSPSPTSDSFSLAVVTHVDPACAVLGVILTLRSLTSAATKTDGWTSVWSASSLSSSFGVILVIIRSVKPSAARSSSHQPSQESQMAESPSSFGKLPALLNDSRLVSLQSFPTASAVPPAFDTA